MAQRPVLIMIVDSPVHYYRDLSNFIGPYIWTRSESSDVGTVGSHGQILPRFHPSMYIFIFNQSNKIDE